MKFQNFGDVFVAHDVLIYNENKKIILRKVKKKSSSYRRISSIYIYIYIYIYS